MPGRRAPPAGRREGRRAQQPGGVRPAEPRCELLCCLPRYAPQRLRMRGFVTQGTASADAAPKCELLCCRNGPRGPGPKCEAPCRTVGESWTGAGGRLAAPPESGGAPARTQRANFCARTLQAASRSKVRGFARQGRRVQVRCQRQAPWPEGRHAWTRKPQGGLMCCAACCRHGQGARFCAAGGGPPVLPQAPVHANRVLHPAASPASAQKFAP